jgi:hypothetical protein
VNAAAHFDTRGYGVIEGLLDQAQVHMAALAIDVARRDGAMQDGPEGTNAIQQYGPVLGEIYLRHCRARIEEVTGCPLIETYAFWRLYREGGALPKHRDRASCEVTVSIALGTEPDDHRWGFGLTDLQGETVSLALAPGSAIVIQGHRISHWRERLDAMQHKQLFLHYVHRDGAYAANAYDGRTHDPLGRKVPGAQP